MLGVVQQRRTPDVMAEIDELKAEVARLSRRLEGLGMGVAALNMASNTGQN